MAYDGSLKFDTKIDRSGFEGDAAVLKKSALALGAAAAAGIGAAVKKGMDFEAQMSKVGSITLAGAEDMAILSAKAKEMGEKTVFSASQAGEAFEYMAMAGWKTEDMVSGISGIMDLAAASGEDLGLVSDIVTDALTAFGLTAADSGRFADVLAAASSNANTNVSMMGETFKYVAPVAGAMGYSVEDTAAAIGLMANSGIKASQAGTSLRQILLGLQGGTELTGKALGKYTVEVENADGSMKDLGSVIRDLRGAFSKMTAAEKAANAENIAGKIGMSGLLAIVNAADSDFNKLTNAIENSSGVTAEMADRNLDNLKGQLTLAGSAAEGLGIAVYEGIQEPLKTAVKEGAGKISELTAAFKNGELSGALQNVGSLLGSLVSGLVNLAGAVIPPLISALSFLGENFSSLATAAAAGVVAVKGYTILGQITSGFKAAAAAITAKTAATTLGQAADVRGITISALKLKYDSAYVASLSAQQIGVSVLTGKTTLLTAAKAMATKAQLALNAAWAANPAGVVIVAAAALVAVLGALYFATQKETEKERILREQHEKNAEAVKELSDEYNSFTTSQAEKAAAHVVEMDHVKSLTNELSRMVDKNGEVRDSDKVRADFILNELNGALGTEYKQISDIIDANGNLKQSVLDVIEAKKLQILMETAEESYKEAVNKKTEAQNNYTQAVINAQSAHEQLNAKYKELSDARQVLAEKEEALHKAVIEGNQAEINALQGSIEAANITVNNVKRGYDDLYNENASLLKAEEDAKEVLDGYTDSINIYNTAQQMSADSISDTITYLEKELGAVSATDKAIKEAADGTQEKLDALGQKYGENLVALKAALENYAKNSSSYNLQVVDEAVAAVNSSYDDFVAAGGNLAGGIISGIGGREINLNPFISEVSAALQNGDTQGLGRYFADGFKIGIDENAAAAADAAGNMTQGAVGAVADAQQSHSPAKKTIELGQYFSSGLAQGITSGKQDVIIAASSVATAAIDAAKKAGKIASPSKVMRDEVGRYYVQGFALGISENSPLLISAAEGLNEELLESEKLYLAEKERIENEQAAEDERQRRAQYEKRLSEAKTAAERQQIINEENLRLKKKADKDYLDALKKTAEEEKELANAELKAMEKLKKEIQRIYGEITDYANEQLDAVIKKQEAMAEKLKSYGSLYTETTITISGMGEGGSDLVRSEMHLNNFSEDIQALTNYRDALESIKQRLTETFDPDTAKDFSTVMADMSVEEGTRFANLLKSASDEEFTEYINGWLEKRALSDEISKEFYSDDMKEAVDKSTLYMKTELEKVGLEVPDGFFTSGSLSAENFGSAFVEELDKQLEIIRKKINDFNASVMPAYAFSAGGGAGGGGVINNTTTNVNVGTTKNTTYEQINAWNNEISLKRLSGVEG